MNSKMPDLPEDQSSDQLPDNNPDNNKEPLLGKREGPEGNPDIGLTKKAENIGFTEQEISELQRIYKSAATKDKDA